MLPDTTIPEAGHSFTTIDGIRECFGCGEPEEHPFHRDHPPMRNNLIAALGAAVKRAGGVMTLHGKPVSVAELQSAAYDSALDRIENALNPRGIRLGDIVCLRGFKKGSDRAHVVVGGPSAGRVKLAYAGSARFFGAKWYPVEFVIRDVDDSNPYVKRARKLLAKHTTVGADGWKRIVCGARYGGIGEAETVGHVEVP